MASKLTITIPQAAEVLNVPEAFVRKLLYKGTLSTHGGEGAIYLKDVMKFQKEQRIKSRKALDEMIRMNQEMGLYDPIEDKDGK
jgi:hypothetical protein